MAQSSNLKIYKASAGSGKTFRLTVQYITMLVNEPDSYRNILAVTFTNKAVAEMKQRILSQLYGIGHNLQGSQSYYEEVKKAVGLDEQTIRRNALLSLYKILQDYGRFRIETIDSFFQTVLRGLARELHIGDGLTLELDTGIVVDEAVDSFLAEVQHNSPDKKNIMAFVESNIEDDKAWKIDKTLKGFSQELFKERFMEKGQKLRLMLSNPDAAIDYKRNLAAARNEIKQMFEEDILEKGREFETALSDSGFGMEKLASNPQKVANKIIDGTILDTNLTKTFQNCIDDPEKFFTKATLKDYPQLSSVAGGLSDIFSEVETLHTEYTRLKNSYDLALQYIHELSLLLSIRKEIDRQSEEQERFILADTPQLLSELKEGDTSFVFEKTGSFIRHVMIDEFQDTSRLQWRNLYILLLECLASRQDCLVVGDVKQSIYRWRNSDWNILNSGLEKELSTFGPTVISMDSNYRSCRRIIEFNNTLFPQAVKVLAEYYKEKTGTDYPALAHAYDGVEQKSPKTDISGYVYAEVITENFKSNELLDLICDKIEKHLDRLIAGGVTQNDIAILCRKKDHISGIAEWFAQNRPEYNMISSEAFQLSSSVSVRILINALKWLSDNSNTIALAQLVWDMECYVKESEKSFDTIMAEGLESHLPEKFTEQQASLRYLPLYELTEKLYGILELNRIRGQDQYVMTFFDLICQWLSHSTGELSAFITEWDENLCSTPIPATDVNGIRLLTIHKSKGLEFHTVIVPFCDWKIISSRHDERIWVEPEEEPFNMLPFIPVGFNDRLGKSVFEEDYRKEAGLQVVDNLNLLYVALTRAENNLILFSNRPLKGGYSVNDVLENCLKEVFDCTDTDDGIVYECGEISPHNEKSAETSNNPFNMKPDSQELVMRSYPISANFRQSGDSTRFIYSDEDDGERREEYIETGRLLHNLFATIRTESDVDAQVDAMLREGLIGTIGDADKLKHLIHDHIAKSGVTSWFDGNYTLFNEASIIFRDGDVLQTRRPDRVMITPEGHAIVVDFKFGREREEYMHQVREYMNLIKKMGYHSVEGHIWYVYNNKVTDC
jgi:ATP-dependent helicase/nuclease subunit A